MRAILIDPKAKDVAEVEYDGDCRTIYKLCNFELFTVIHLGGGETLFIDDEGLLKDPQSFFCWRGYPQPLAGRGLILGENDDGESVATKLELEAVRAKVSFPELELTGWTPSISGKGETGAGEGFVIRGPQPVFEPIAGPAKSERVQ